MNKNLYVTNSYTTVISHLYKICFLFLLAFSIGSAQAQNNYWQQQVNFIIDVTLDDTAYSLDGFEKIEYINNSPDTLSFIWIHCWPNAFKNDRTAFSEQQLQNNDTKFYFSEKSQRGYINRLDFRINNEIVSTEDHPQYIDIIKLVLPHPLTPGEKVIITTPFHVQLPENFSRGGHVGQAFQVTQWYPKPAVYDRTGWHPIPYLEQGEFYNDFGNYQVRITLPKKYILAATGELQSATSGNPSTYSFIQNNVHDFAWFADEHFIVRTDTIMLGGRVIKASIYYLPQDSAVWSKGIEYIKKAIHFRSELIGEYPFNTVSVVEAKMGFQGGMEYPTITSISPLNNSRELEYTIEHEIGHNWFQGILASNERQFPWMDEGINTYYDLRYFEKSAQSTENNKGRFAFTEESLASLGIRSFENLHLDQPIATPSSDFTATNYFLIAYYKTAQWLQLIEKKIGRPAFDEAMRSYFKVWQFRHPYPSDLQQVLETSSGHELNEVFALLNKKGRLQPYTGKTQTKIIPFFSLNSNDSVRYISIMPALGYNKYDGFMIGALVHNFNPPPTNFKFVAAPVYATRSKQLNAIGLASYTFYPSHTFHSIEVGINGSRFSSLSGIDSNNNRITGGFYKISPFLNFILKNKDERSRRFYTLQYRTYFIGEKNFLYVQKKSDNNYYPSINGYDLRYINQLTARVDDYRKLYPYDAELQLQQAKDFVRLNLNAHYFLNYAHYGGLQVRLFAAKFGYIGAKTSSKEFATYNYQPKLTAVRGYEDYTYSNYFFGRNENSGFASQQVMMRDGGLKLRTDLFQGLQGRSDNWVASLNFNTTLPKNLLPIPLPIKLFLDAGTYAGAWKKNSTGSRFLYVGGLQLSLLHDIINIYAPVIYSNEFKNQLKTVPEENTFIRRISFSIDIQKISLWSLIFK